MPNELADNLERTIALIQRSYWRGVVTGFCLAWVAFVLATLHPVRWFFGLA